MLTGVAGGVAEALDVDPSIIRIVWVLLAFLTGGIALVVYVVMAIVVPERPPGVPVAGHQAAGPNDAVASEPVPEGSWRAPDGSTVPQAAAAPRTARPARDPADRARLGFVLGL